MRISDLSSDVCSSDLPQYFGVPTLDLAQLPRRLAAAGGRHLAPRIAQPLVDRVDRQAQMARHRFRVMAIDQQAQGLLFLFGERLNSCHLGLPAFARSEEHTSELQSLMRHS